MRYVGAGMTHIHSLFKSDDAVKRGGCCRVVNCGAFSIRSALLGSVKRQALAPCSHTNDEELSMRFSAPSSPSPIQIMAKCFGTAPRQL